MVCSKKLGNNISQGKRMVLRGASRCFVRIILLFINLIFLFSANPLHLYPDYT